MDDLSTKTVCIADQGLFVSLAEHLAPHFAKVLYVTGTAGSFPTTAEYSVGTGIEGVERLPDISDALGMADDIDLWIFSDLYQGGIQKLLRGLGARVWGAGAAEEMELNRLKFKRWARKAGLAGQEDGEDYFVVKGVDALREFLKSHEGWPVKTARFAPTGRGDFETIKPGYSLEHLRYRLDDIEATLGVQASSTEFIVERPITDAVELATDIYSVDGEFPDRGILGLEIKGEGYVGRRIDYDDYPEGLRAVNEAASAMYKRTKLRSQCAIECRITKTGVATPIDPCLRFGRPPLSVQAQITNWPEVFWEGGSGRLAEPKFAAEWCAESCIYSDYAETHNTYIEFPEDLARDHLKLSNYCVKGGKRYVVPQSYKLSGLGSVVATGSTMAKAIANVRELSKQLKGYDTKASDPFDEAEAEIAKMKSFGVTGFG